MSYTQEQNDAYLSILEAGVLTKLNRVLSSYDPVEGGETVTDVYQSNAAIVALPSTSSISQQYETSFIEDLKIGRARFFYLAGKGLVFLPQPGDLLLFQGMYWDVVGSSPLDPDGATPILYTLGVRQSQITTINVDTDPAPPTLPGAEIIFSWQHYVLRYKASTVTAVTGGQIRQYDSDTDTVYRFEPSPYDYDTDGFYRSFDGVTFSGLIVTRK
jgi:hypothetical protein